MVIHILPFWFLVFALFLPRIAMLVAWLQGTLAPFHLETVVRGHMAGGFPWWCGRCCRGCWCCI